MMKTVKLLVGVAVAIFATSCGSTQYLVTSNSENLNVLTKITDSETTRGVEANGGYGYGGILLTIRSNEYPGYCNIYKKENPLAPSMAQVTSGENFNDGPVYCVATDRIAYSKASSGSTADIYMVPATKGSAMIPVTETSNYNEFDPSFSSDGRYIAFQKSPGAWNNIDSEIWLKDLTTSETMLLCTGHNPMISPDGTKIAFSKYDGKTESHIWVMNIDGSNAQQLTGSKKELAFAPCWSPNGEFIVFHGSTDQKKDSDLYVIRADGTGLRQLTNNESSDYRPYWHSDNMIYFTSDRGGKKGDVQIWRFQYYPY